jgi:DNA polymerase-1
VLYLIDGNSLVYRAFFALPEAIATSRGEPTNAIFGFASMLVKLITDHGVEPTVVAWDAGSSGRDELYDQYKAGRRSRPDLLREQWPAFDPLVEAFGYRNARLEGYEADDVIATLAERARTQGIPVTIVTGDRDAFQLVDEAGLVRVMATARGITETKLYDRDTVIERYGIPPELIPDFYGLKGDTSDNIPGIPGIGEKTAAELLQRFGSLEAILDRVDEVSGEKRRENVRLHRDDAVVSKQLATMRRDLPLELDLAAINAGEPDMTAIRDTFRRFELRDPLRRLEEVIGEIGAGGAPAARETVRPRTVTLGQLAALGDGELAVAVREPMVPEGALFADSPALSFGVATATEVLSGEMGEGPELVGALATHPLVVHDAKSLGSVPRQLAHDTMLGAYLLDPARRGYPLHELLEDRGLAAEPDGAPADALLTKRLAELQRAELAASGLEELLREVELPLVSVLREMELAGVGLDVPQLAEVGTRVNEEIEKLERAIYAVAGEEFVIGSPQQLGAILFEKLGLSRKRRGKTGFSTDARVLQAIRSEHEIIPMVERWRELSTLIKTYLEPLPVLVDAQSRLHTTFLQTVAATGRLSSTNPNLQNIPIRTPLGREIRRCIVAAPGNVLVPCRRGRPHRHRLPGLPGRARGDRRRDALEGEDDQLRDRLRPDGLRPRRPPPDPARGSGGIHRDLLRALPQGPRVHRQHDRAGDRAGLCHDVARTASADPRAARAQSPAAGAPPAPRGEHRYAGNRRRHHQGRDGARARRARRRSLAPDPPDPRRADDRRSGGGGRRGAQPAHHGDGSRLGARPATRRRRRRRRKLARREVIAAQRPASSASAGVTGHSCAGGGVIR